MCGIQREADDDDVIYFTNGKSWRGRTSVRLRFPLGKMYYLIFLFPRSGSKTKRGVELASQHTMSRKFGGKCKTEYLNTLFPLSMLVCAGNSV